MSQIEQIEPKKAVEMPPEFTADNCESTASLVQYRIDRCIERDGSREAAIKAGGISLSIGHMEMVVGALNKGASEIRSLLSALKEARELAAGHQKYIDILQGVRDKEDAAFASLRAERDALASSLEASEAEQARLIADLDGAKDAATVAYKAEVAKLTAERDALATERDAKDAALQSALDAAQSLTARCDALVDALKEAEGALKPFEIAAIELDTEPGGYLWRDNQHIIKWITAGNLRRARAALASIKATLEPGAPPK